MAITLTEIDISQRLNEAIHLLATPLMVTQNLISTTKHISMRGGARAAGVAKWRVASVVHTPHG